MKESAKLSIEECKSLYFDDDVLLEPVRRLYRINNYKNGRYYYSYDKNGDPIFYISVTNMIAQTMPTSPHLIKWIAEKGIEEAENYKEERADYGTLMHITFQKLLIEKTLNLDEIDELVEGYCNETGNKKEAENWADELKSDVLAFAQWVIDFNVKPVFIEVVLGSDTELYGGAVDLGCYLDMEVKGFFGEKYKTGPRKGPDKETKMKKRAFAIVDFKSGKKGFYENNVIQLQAYKKLALQNFPQLGDQEIYLFNFSPKNWRTEPSYNFKDQTYSKSADKLEALTMLSKIQNGNREKEIVVKSGIIDFTKDEKSISSNYQTVNFSEYLKEKNE